MTQHRVTYIPICTVPGRVLIKTQRVLCGPLGTFPSEEAADDHARSHITYTWR